MSDLFFALHLRQRLTTVGLLLSTRISGRRAGNLTTLSIVSYRFAQSREIFHHSRDDLRSGTRPSDFSPVGRHYARRLAVFCEPGFLGLREVLQSADARFANLESMVVRYVEGPPTLRTGTPI